jgi:hypothetical protein
MRMPDSGSPGACGHRHDAGDQRARGRGPERAGRSKRRPSRVSTVVSRAKASRPVAGARRPRLLPSSSVPKSSLRTAVGDSHERLVVDHEHTIGPRDRALARCERRITRLAARGNRGLGLGRALGLQAAQLLGQRALRRELLVELGLLAQEHLERRLEHHEVRLHEVRIGTGLEGPRRLPRATSPWRAAPAERRNCAESGAGAARPRRRRCRS